MISPHIEMRRNFSLATERLKSRSMFVLTLIISLTLTIGRTLGDMRGNNIAKKWALLHYYFSVFTCFCMYWYIFHSGGGKIPSALQGTAADPVMFMSGKELFKW